MWLPEQSAYNAQRAGVTTAIVMAILVPIAIAAACLVCWIRDYVRNRRGDNYDDYYDEEPRNTAVYKPTTTSASGIPPKPRDDYSS